MCEIFNFVDVCSGVGIVWSTTTRTRVNAVSFSVNWFNLLKLYPMSGNTSDGGLLHTFYSFTSI